MSSIKKYSFGIGNRFAHQAEAQLQAFVKAQGEGVDITPVWNKSYREHMTVGSVSRSVRVAADDAVRNLGWSAPYYLDADHINGSNVDFSLDTCEYYTIDVAEFIGHAMEIEEAAALRLTLKRFVGGSDSP